MTVPASANMVLAHLYPNARNIFSAKRGNAVAIRLPGKCTDQHGTLEGVCGVSLNLRQRLCPANAEDAYMP